VRTVHRWGQSAYETDEDLALERRAAEALGLRWTRSPESAEPPPLDGVDCLVVTSRVKVSRQVLDRFPGELVVTTTSGWEHVDVLAANDRGVTVARCPLARRDAVVEQTVGAAIQLLRRQPAFDRFARAGVWARAELPALDPLILRDATVLIVGLGVIGRRLAEVLSPFGACLLGVDPAGVPLGVVPVDLDEGLSRADVVTLHCAANPTTVGLLSAWVEGAPIPHRVRGIG
jgi:D-3-phosphoglycerate dehydrogenase